MRLKISDVELDVYDPREIPVAATFEVTDHDKPGSAKGSQSNRISVPLTQKNVAILGLGTPGEALLDRALLPFEVSNGAGAIWKGSAVMEAHRRDEGDLKFFGDNAEWFPLLKGRKIGDLSLGRSKVHSLAHVQDSWVGTEIVLYPVIDRGNFYDKDSTYDVDLKYILPSVRVRNIMDALFASIGYTPIYDGYFEHIINNTFVQFTDEIEKLRADQPTLTAHGITLETTTPVVSPAHGADIDHATVVADPSSQFIAPGRFEVDFDCRAWVNWRFTLDGFTMPTGAQFNLYFALYDYTAAAVVENAGWSFSSLETVFSQTLVFEDVQLIAGHVYGIKYITHSGTLPGGWTIVYGEFKAIIKNIPWQSGSRCELASVLPEMDQDEFLLGFLRLGCARVDTDPGRHEITIACEDDYLEAEEEAEDWTKKVDVEPEPIERSRPKEMAERFDYKWKEDTSDALRKAFQTNYRRGLGDATHKITDQNASGVEEIELPFAATYTGPALGGILMPRMYRDGQTGYDDAEYKFAPRILVYHGTKGGDWTCDGTLLDTITDCGFIRPNSSFNDLSLAFGEEGGIYGNDIGLIARLHRSRLNRVEYGRRLRAFIHLDDFDIHNLSFRKAKRLLVYGSYATYYLLKVDQYLFDQNGSTPCEFISTGTIPQPVTSKGQLIQPSRR